MDLRISKSMSYSGRVGHGIGWAVKVFHPWFLEFYLEVDAAQFAFGSVLSYPSYPLVIYLLASSVDALIIVSVTSIASYTDLCWPHLFPSPRVQFIFVYSCTMLIIGLAWIFPCWLCKYWQLMRRNLIYFVLMRRDQISSSGRYRSDGRRSPQFGISEDTVNSLMCNHWFALMHRHCSIMFDLLPCNTLNSVRGFNMVSVDNDWTLLSFCLLGDDKDPNIPNKTSLGLGNVASSLLVHRSWPILSYLEYFAAKGKHHVWRKHQYIPR